MGEHVAGEARTPVFCHKRNSGANNATSYPSSDLYFFDESPPLTNSPLRFQDERSGFPYVGHCIKFRKCEAVAKGQKPVPSKTSLANDAQWTYGVVKFWDPKWHVLFVHHLKRDVYIDQKEEHILRLLKTVHIDSLLGGVVSWIESCTNDIRILNIGKVFRRPDWCRPGSNAAKSQLEPQKSSQSIGETDSSKKHGSCDSEAVIVKDAKRKSPLRTGKVTPEKGTSHSQDVKVAEYTPPKAKPQRKGDLSEDKWLSDGSDDEMSIHPHGMPAVVGTMNCSIGDPSELLAEDDKSFMGMVPDTSPSAVQVDANDMPMGSESKMHGHTTAEETWNRGDERCSICNEKITYFVHGRFKKEDLRSVTAHDDVLDFYGLMNWVRSSMRQPNDDFISPIHVQYMYMQDVGHITKDEVLDLLGENIEITRMVMRSVLANGVPLSNRCKISLSVKMIIWLRHLSGFKGEITSDTKFKVVYWGVRCYDCGEAYHAKCLPYIHLTKGPPWMHPNVVMRRLRHHKTVCRMYSYFATMPPGKSSINHYRQNYATPVRQNSVLYIPTLCNEVIHSVSAYITGGKRLKDASEDCDTPSKGSERNKDASSGDVMCTASRSERRSSLRDRAAAEYNGHYLDTKGTWGKGSNLKHESDKSNGVTHPCLFNDELKPNTHCLSGNHNASDCEEEASVVFVPFIESRDCQPWKCDSCTLCMYCCTSTVKEHEDTHSVDDENPQSQQKTSYHALYPSSLAEKIDAMHIKNKGRGEVSFVRCVSCNAYAHKRCCNPVIPELAFLESWRCEACLQCICCGYRDSVIPNYMNWGLFFLFCLRCWKAFEKSNYCGICYRIWTHLDNTTYGWVQCDGCKLWVHTDCDSNSSLISNSVNNRMERYKCPACRSPNRLDRLFRVLELIFNVDRCNQFRYPLPGAYTFFWGIVLRPMDLLTIRKKLDDGAYHSFEQFVFDVMVMSHNAKILNMPNTKIYKLASSFALRCKYYMSGIFDISDDDLELILHNGLRNAKLERLCDKIERITSGSKFDNSKLPTDIIDQSLNIDELSALSCKELQRQLKVDEYDSRITLDRQSQVYKTKIYQQMQSSRLQENLKQYSKEYLLSHLGLPHIMYNLEFAQRVLPLPVVRCGLTFPAMAFLHRRKGVEMNFALAFALDEDLVKPLCSKKLFIFNMESRSAKDSSHLLYSSDPQFMAKVEKLLFHSAFVDEGLLSEFCVVCGSSAYSNYMTYCEICGEAFHYYCAGLLFPPQFVNYQNFRCASCAVCDCCNCRVVSNHIYDISNINDFRLANALGWTPKLIDYSNFRLSTDELSHLIIDFMNIKLGQVDLDDEIVDFLKSAYGSPSSPIFKHNLAFNLKSKCTTNKKDYSTPGNKSETEKGDDTRVENMPMSWARPCVFSLTNRPPLVNVRCSFCGNVSHLRCVMKTADKNLQHRMATKRVGSRLTVKPKATAEKKECGRNTAGSSSKQRKQRGRPPCTRELEEEDIDVYIPSVSKLYSNQPKTDLLKAGVNPKNEIDKNVDFVYTQLPKKQGKGRIHDKKTPLLVERIVDHKELYSPVKLEHAGFDSSPGNMTIVRNVEPSTLTMVAAPNIPQMVTVPSTLQGSPMSMPAVINSNMVNAVNAVPTMLTTVSGERVEAVVQQGLLNPVPQSSGPFLTELQAPTAILGACQAPLTTIGTAHNTVGSPSMGSSYAVQQTNPVVLTTIPQAVPLTIQGTLIKGIPNPMDTVISTVEVATPITGIQTYSPQVVHSAQPYGQGHQPNYGELQRGNVDHTGSVVLDSWNSVGSVSNTSVIQYKTQVVRTPEGFKTVKIPYLSTVTGHVPDSYVNLRGSPSLIAADFTGMGVSCTSHNPPQGVDKAHPTFNICGDRRSNLLQHQVPPVQYVQGLNAELIPQGYICHYGVGGNIAGRNATIIGNRTPIRGQTRVLKRVTQRNAGGYQSRIDSSLHAVNSPSISDKRKGRRSYKSRSLSGSMDNENNDSLPEIASARRATLMQGYESVVKNTISGRTRKRGAPRKVGRTSAGLIPSNGSAANKGIAIPDDMSDNQNSPRDPTSGNTEGNIPKRRRGIQLVSDASKETTHGSTEKEALPSCWSHNGSGIFSCCHEQSSQLESCYNSFHYPHRSLFMINRIPKEDSMLRDIFMLSSNHSQIDETNPSVECIDVSHMKHEKYSKVRYNAALITKCVCCGAPVYVSAKDTPVVGNINDASCLVIKKASPIHLSSSVGCYKLCAECKIWRVEWFGDVPKGAESGYHHGVKRCQERTECENTAFVMETVTKEMVKVIGMARNWHLLSQNIVKYFSGIVMQSSYLGDMYRRESEVFCKELISKILLDPTFYNCGVRSQLYSSMVNSPMSPTAFMLWADSLRNSNKVDRELEEVFNDTTRVYNALQRSRADGSISTERVAGSMAMNTAPFQENKIEETVSMSSSPDFSPHDALSSISMSTAATFSMLQQNPQRQLNYGSNSSSSETTPGLGPVYKKDGLMQDIREDYFYGEYNRLQQSNQVVSVERDTQTPMASYHDYLIDEDFLANSQQTDHSSFYADLSPAGELVIDEVTENNVILQDLNAQSNDHTTDINAVGNSPEMVFFPDQPSMVSTQQDNALALGGNNTDMGILSRFGSSGSPSIKSSSPLHQPIPGEVLSSQLSITQDQQATPRTWTFGQQDGFNMDQAVRQLNDSSFPSSQCSMTEAKFQEALMVSYGSVVKGSSQIVKMYQVFYNMRIRHSTQGKMSAHRCFMEQVETTSGSILELIRQWYKLLDYFIGETPNSEEDPKQKDYPYMRRHLLHILFSDLDYYKTDLRRVLELCGISYVSPSYLRPHTLHYVMHCLDFEAQSIMMIVQQLSVLMGSSNASKLIQDCKTDEFTAMNARKFTDKSFFWGHYVHYIRGALEGSGPYKKAGAYAAQRFVQDFMAMSSKKRLQRESKHRNKPMKALFSYLENVKKQLDMTYKVGEQDSEGDTNQQFYVLLGYSLITETVSARAVAGDIDMDSFSYLLYSSNICGTTEKMKLDVSDMHIKDFDVYSNTSKAANRLYVLQKLLPRRVIISIDGKVQYHLKYNRKKYCCLCFVSQNTLIRGSLIPWRDGYVHSECLLWSVDNAYLPRAYNQNYDTLFLSSCVLMQDLFGVTMLDVLRKVNSRRCKPTQSDNMRSCGVDIDENITLGSQMFNLNLTDIRVLPPVTLSDTLVKAVVIDSYDMVCRWCGEVGAAIRCCGGKCNLVLHLACAFLAADTKLSTALLRARYECNVESESSKEYFPVKIYYTRRLLWCASCFKSNIIAKVDKYAFNHLININPKQMQAFLALEGMSSSAMFIASQRITQSVRIIPEVIYFSKVDPYISEIDSEYGKLISEFKHRMTGSKELDIISNVIDAVIKPISAARVDGRINLLSGQMEEMYNCRCHRQQLPREPYYFRFGWSASSSSPFSNCRVPRRARTHYYGDTSFIRETDDLDSVLSSEYLSIRHRRQELGTLNAEENEDICPLQMGMKGDTGNNGASKGLIYNFFMGSLSKPEEKTGLTFPVFPQNLRKKQLETFIRNNDMGGDVESTTESSYLNDISVGEDDKCRSNVTALKSFVNAKEVLVEVDSDDDRENEDHMKKADCIPNGHIPSDLVGVIRSGALTILSMGDGLIFDYRGSAFPVGFTSVRIYWGRRNLNNLQGASKKVSTSHNSNKCSLQARLMRAAYLCTVRVKSNQPHFSIYPLSPYTKGGVNEGAMAEGFCLKDVYSCFMKGINRETPHRFSALEFFGLNHPYVVQELRFKLCKTILHRTSAFFKARIFTSAMSGRMINKLHNKLKPILRNGDCVSFSPTEDEIETIKSKLRTVIDFTGMYPQRMSVSGDPIDVTWDRKKYDLVSAYSQYKYLTSMPPEKRLEVRDSNIHGYGLFATEEISAGDPVIEYIGELVRENIGDEREEIYSKEQGGDGSCYMFRLNEELIVDATRKGSMSRFINHSCEPNCICRIVTCDKGLKHIVVFAKDNIKRGDEITYDYKFGVEGEAQKLRCLCGAFNCMGRMN